TEDQQQGVGELRRRGAAADERRTLVRWQGERLVQNGVRVGPAGKVQHAWRDSARDLVVTVETPIVAASMTRGRLRRRSTEVPVMGSWRPDQSFYPPPRMAMAAPAEGLAYVAMLNPAFDGPDALGVVDLHPRSKSYGQLVG